MTWLYRLSKAADLHFKTNSDIGGVAVGTEDFCVNLGNGYGDGTTNVYVFNTKRIPGELEEFLKFNTCIGGKFNIYEDDISVCEKAKSKVVCTLEGYYGAYYPKNEIWWDNAGPVVVLEKWDDVK